MPRRVAEPPLPDTPGGWLACYRYRCRADDGARPSPEEIGSSLGVSGATVRRWETARSRPDEADLSRFADVCALTPLEREFIFNAFAAKSDEQPPDQAEFQAAMSQVLSSDFPAFVMDSLYFVRAWNTYMTIFPPFLGPDPAHNVFATHLGVPQTEETPEDREDRLADWMRDFWLSTAGLCGSRAYRRLLSDLCGVGDFEARWRKLALEQSDARQGRPGEAGAVSEGDSPRRGLATARQPGSAPYYFRSPSLGTFRVYPIKVICPPAYHVREYVPLDDLGRRRLDEMRRSASPVASFSAAPHWAVDPRLT